MVAKYQLKTVGILIACIECLEDTLTTDAQAEKILSYIIKEYCLDQLPIPVIIPNIPYLPLPTYGAGAKGDTGNGIASTFYDDTTGILTFYFTDGTSYSTGDIRGGDGRSITNTVYNPADGKVTFYYSDGTSYSTGDLRGRGITNTAIVAGRLIITYTDTTTQDAGAVTSITLTQIIGNDLIITYNNGNVVNVGRVVGRDGTDGRGIASTSYSSSTGKVTFTYTDGTTFVTGDLRGNGIASTSYNSSTGILTFTFTDGTTFSTGDLRGGTGATGNGIASTSYNSSTGVLTLTYTNGSTYSTGDLRGRGIASTSYNSSTGAVTFTYTDGTTSTTGDLRGNGITSITQPSPLVMRVATRDFTNDITLYKGADGPSNLNFLKTAQQTIEHFEGNGTATISNLYALTLQNGATYTQRTSLKTGFKSASLVDFSISTSSPAALWLLRRSIGTGIFGYSFNPPNQLCEMEVKFSLDQLPTSANQFDFEIRMTDTSNNAFVASANGVQAKITWDSAISSAGIVLTTLASNLTSISSTYTTISANTAYTLRIVYNYSSTLCQLYLNGSVILTRTLNLPTAFLSPSLRIGKVSGATACTGTIDYLECVATDQ